MRMTHDVATYFSSGTMLFLFLLFFYSHIHCRSYAFTENPKIRSLLIRLPIKCYSFHISFGDAQQIPYHSNSLNHLFFLVRQKPSSVVFLDKYYNQNPYRKRAMSQYCEISKSLECEQRIMTPRILTRHTTLYGITVIIIPCVPFVSDGSANEKYLLNSISLNWYGSIH